jgi:hypothetical protein
VISKVTANDNGTGIGVDGNGAAEPLNVTIVDSVVSNNSTAGVQAFPNLRRTVPAVMLRNVVASNNGVGLLTSQNTILRVAHSVVTGNNTGVNTAGGGTIFSYGDSDIDGNTNNNTGVLTRLAMH